MNDLGREKILIPLTPEQLTAEVIREYLPNVLITHFRNSADYVYWLDYFKGRQPILQKKRYNGSEINNLIVVNHAAEAVKFLKGHTFGDPVKYSKKETDKTDDIDILNTYMIEQDKATLNSNLAEAFYVSGVALMWCWTRKEDVDLSKQAPFDLQLLDNQNGFVAYSTGIHGDKLFGGVIVRIKGDTPDHYRYNLTIYTKQAIYSYEYEASAYNSIPTRHDIRFMTQQPNPLGVIPIVEYPLNNTRQGILEIGHHLEDAINLILSNNLDDVQQRVNAILVFINQLIEKEDVEKLRSMGAITLVDPDNQRHADAKYVVNPLDHTDIRNTLDMLQQLLYAIRGVPQASGVVTSGGDTGQARLLGGGWTRAEVFIKNYILAFTKADRELLDVMLTICKATPDCPVDTITASDIDITFNINRSDNLLVKVQSLSNLITMNMPKEVALNIVGLVGDAREVAALWDAEVEKAKAAELQETSERPDENKTQNVREDEKTQEE